MKARNCITIGQIRLEDCGKTLEITDPFYKYTVTKKIQMIIESPRGRLVLYDSRYKDDIVNQREAIRTFMEVHKDG